MSSKVSIVSGDLPRYFSFGAVSAGRQVLSTTTNQASNAIFKQSPYSTFQGIVTGTGAVTATLTVQVSNEDATAAGTKSNWITLGTITLSGTTVATDGFTSVAPWRWVRVNVTGVTGTGATVEAIMGV